MLPFYEVAVPHGDILGGRHTPEVFAAKLGEVFKGKASDEYKDPTQFFENTHETEGLTRLLSVVERRLKGLGGDPVIQIQTPFGGGKTHAQIAMYHKASKWNARRVVIDGAAIDAEKETLWGMLEKQLMGKMDRFNRVTSPGRDALCELLSKQRKPVLILIDELLEYATKAAGVEVGDSTRAAQTVAFMQELTEAAGILKKVALVLTLPSSAMEHFDQTAERLYSQLQKVSGRVKKIYTPVEDHEIAEVIRHRLFSKFNEVQAHKAIDEFMVYAKAQSLLPPGEPSVYRERFEASYPFLPETIDVLYHRWGSLRNFQRTRGVLRLLALVIYSLKKKKIPYISLADFDLSVQDIRQELLEHIGMAYDSVISADITGDDVGAKKVDMACGDSYKTLKLGSRAATTVFMYSFLGELEQNPVKGATLGEIKRSAAIPPYESSAVVEASEKLKRRLFFLQDDGERVYFTTEANLNSILHTKMENLDDVEINACEEKLLKDSISGNTFKVFIWPKDGSGIPDDAELKLVILKEHDDTLMKEILETKGKGPTIRANRNMLFFLTPLERERMGFYRHLREYLAYRAIDSEKRSELSRAQQQQVRAAYEKAEGALNDRLRRYYRTVFVPEKTFFKESDLGIPDAVIMKLDEVVNAHLQAEGDILEILQPVVIKEMYLRSTEYVRTEQLYNSSATTRGALRTSNSEAWENGIRDGVEQGQFGLGKLEEGKPVCYYFGKEERPTDVTLSGDEVIMSANLCVNQSRTKPGDGDDGSTGDETLGSGGDEQAGGDENSNQNGQNGLKEVSLKFTVPQGQVSGLLGMMKLLQSNFDTLQIQLLATNGEMSEQDYEDKIGETLMQLGIVPE